MAQPKSRVPLALGLTAAGGIGYYLYGAGGSPKAAEKQFEGWYSVQCYVKASHVLIELLADASKASAKIQGELPGRGTQAKKQGEAWATEAGNKLDSAVSFSVTPGNIT